MHSLRLCALLLLACTVGAQTTPQQGIRDKTPDSKAFTNARIVVAPGRVIDDGTVIIDEGRITAVGADLAVPDGALEIDLDGKWLYAGFVDPYSGYGLPEPDKPMRQRRPVYEAERIGGSAWNEAIHADKYWAEQFTPDAKASERLMKAGLTVVHTIHRDGIFRGRGCVALLGVGLPNDLLIEPVGLPCMSFDKGSSKQSYPSSLMGSIALIRQTLLDADWYGRAHAAFARNPRQEMPEFNASLEEIDSYGDAPVIFETTSEMRLLRADRIAKEFSKRFIEVGSGREYMRMTDIKATGATIILPLDYPEPPNVGSIEDELDVSLAELRHWEWAPSNPAILEDNGVTFAFTTHRLNNPGDLLPRISRAIERGLSPETALAALTTVPAGILGIDDRAGTIEVGKLANFVISDGDVFEKKSSIYATVIKGDVHEFMPLDQQDFRGRYSLTIDNDTIILDLTGDLTSIAGTMKRDTMSATLKKVDVGRTSLHFAVELDDISSAIDGTARFTARKSAGQLADIGLDPGDKLTGDDGTARGTIRIVASSLEGIVDLPDGRRLNWVAHPRTGSRSDSTADDESEAEMPDTALVSRLTYPNKAYGFDALPKPQNVLVTGATVWTCEPDGILEDADVLVVNGKFEAIGKDLEAPSDAVVIDATGKHVTPGIIDVHSHIAIDRNVNEGTHAITCEVRIGDVVDPDDINIYRQLAGGVTGSHLLHGSANPIGGQCKMIKLRWGHSDLDMIFDAVPPTCKFALGENVKQSNWGDYFTIRYPQTRMGVEAIIRDAFIAAREYQAKRAAYDRLGRKQQERTVPPRRNLQLDALVDILETRMFVQCHAYVAPEILMLMRVAEEFGFTIWNFIHVLEGYKVAEEMAEHGATATTFSDWWAYKFEVYDAIPYNPCIMHDQGVLTTINSDDAELARHLNQEAAKSVMYCDMPEEEALDLVTLYAAQEMRVADRVGSIRVGKDADFVIWDGHPLSVYTKAEQTWVDGTKYFDIQRDLLMREQQRLERTALVQKVLAAGGGRANGKPHRGGYGHAPDATRDNHDGSDYAGADNDD